MKQVLIFFIKSYRLLFSPWVGMHCRFTPTCSVYAIEALQNYGTLKGSYIAIKRLLRCHPFARGGYDPIEVSITKHGKMSTTKHNG